MAVKMKSGQLAKRLQVSPATVRHWSDVYAEFMSDSAARRAPGAPRKFTERDAVILATVADGRDKGLTHDQIRRMVANGQYADLPDLPTPEEQQARDSVALVAMPEYERVLSQVQHLTGELQQARDERDRAIERWQTDTTELNDRVRKLERELGEARGQLQALEIERQPAAYWLRIVALAMLVAAVVVAALLLLALRPA